MYTLEQKRLYGELKGEEIEKLFYLQEENRSKYFNITEENMGAELCKVTEECEVLQDLIYIRHFEAVGAIGRFIEMFEVTRGIKTSKTLVEVL